MTIEFSCGGCKYPFKVPATMAGKKGKCPKCGAITPIPTSSTGSAVTTEAAARPRAGAAANPDDLDFDRDDDAGPRRRKKKSKTGLIIGLAIGGVLLLAGIGVGIYFLVGGGGIGDDLKYMPNSTIGMVSIKAAELFDSGIWKDSKKDIPGGSDLEKQMQEKTGFAPADIERVTLGGGTDDEMIIVVKMKKAVKASDIQNALKKSPMASTEFKESKVGNFTVNKSGGDDAPAFCVVNSNLVVGSSKATTLEKVLKRDKKAEFSSSFQAVLGKADFSKTIAVALDVKALKGGKGSGLNALSGLGGPAGMNPGMMLGMLGDSIDGAALAVKIGSGVDASGALICKDAAAADTLKKQADAGLAMARTNAAKEQIELLDRIKISTSGNTITGSFSISQSLIDKLKKVK